jgi:hypothetical protein
MRLTRLIGLLGLFASSSAAAAMNDTRVQFAPFDPLRTEPARAEPAPSGATFLQGIPEASAAGYYQPVDIRPQRLHRVSWGWRVDALPPSADPWQDDIGASVLFVFGVPTAFEPDVPTIAYTWTGAPAARGVPQRSTRQENLFFIQLRGRPDFGRTCTEARDVTGDYLRLFGTMPPPLRSVASFVDGASPEAAPSFGRVLFDA